MRTCGALALRSSSSGIPWCAWPTTLPDCATTPEAATPQARRVQPPHPRSLLDCPRLYLINECFPPGSEASTRQLRRAWFERFGPSDVTVPDRARPWSSCSMDSRFSYTFHSRGLLADVDVKLYSSMRI
eukprot:6181733-Pleurochrysis_carterae.AAC.2